MRQKENELTVPTRMKVLRKGRGVDEGAEEVAKVPVTTTKILVVSNR